MAIQDQPDWPGIRSGCGGRVEGWRKLARRSSSIEAAFHGKPRPASFSFEECDNVFNPVCGKVQYNSRKEAQRYRSRCKARLRIYACRDCGGWHLTKNAQ